MVEYLPWSKKVYSECLMDYKNGALSILDIELGGQCNYHCVYCDSPTRGKKCVISFNSIENAFMENNIKWVFVCGLGEPTFSENFIILKNILSLCEKYGAKCSIFTNLSNLDLELEGYIKKGILYLLFKYDSINTNKVKSLYGACNPEQQVANIDKVKQLVQVNEGCTNLAASIVPTRENINEIITIVKDCLASNIYPLIAELENSGNAQGCYEKLMLTDEELMNIKNEVNALISDKYYIPVCPAVICGLHIRHDGSVTLDEFTGLSCHWFWLEEPRTVVVGDFNTEQCKDLVVKIEKYRDSRLDKIRDLMNTQKVSVFGGCGGDVSYLLKQYMGIKEVQE